MKIPFYKPSIGEDEISEVVDTLRNGWLTTGPKTKQFEKEFAEYLGHKHAVAVNSCTAALHLALEAIGLKAGQGVIVPTMTFAATAEVVRYFGARPILADCRLDDFNLDAADAERKIESARAQGQQVAAIIPVHYGGQIGDVAGVRDLARRYQLKIIEDAAHCCPAYYREKVESGPHPQPLSHPMGEGSAGLPSDCEPSTLNHQPSTLNNPSNPQPSTFNLQPTKGATPHPTLSPTEAERAKSQPPTLNPQPSTLNHQPTNGGATPHQCPHPHPTGEGCAGLHSDSEPSTINPEEKAESRKQKAESGKQNHQLSTLNHQPSLQWSSVGSDSDISCYSFYANKTITTGEGGMACTNHDDYADRMRIMSLHGISRDAWKRFTAEGSWYYEIIAPGFKYNLTDIAAAIGLHQVRKADRLHWRRAALAEHYSERLQKVEEVIVPSVQPDRIHSWHLYVIRLRLDRLKIDRAQFITELQSRGIGTSVHWMPLHMHPYYRETYGYQPLDLANAAALYPQIVSLPLYPDMTGQEVDYVCDSIKQVVARELKRV